jgi:alpha-beta hydrolase superfamily lysophospholipase
MTLREHNGRTSQIFDEKVWLNEVAQSYQDIRSRFPHLPTYVMGYSLGGLTLITMLESISPHTYPRAMILIAPAVALRGFLDVSAFLHLPPPITWAFPNLAPPEYRRYDYTPLFWYSNTLALYRNLGHLQNIKQLATIPTLVVLNEDDEIVSTKATVAWIDENNLSPSWRVEMFHPENSQFPLKEHLIIDEASLGRREWARLRQLIARFLDEAR